jgi:hypothetical protein
MAHMSMLRKKLVLISVPIAMLPGRQMNSITRQSLPTKSIGMNSSGLRSPKNPALCPVALCPFLCRPLQPLLQLLPRPAQTAQTPRDRRGPVQVMKFMLQGRGMGMSMNIIFVVLMMLGMFVMIFSCTRVISQD